MAKKCADAFIDAALDYLSTNGSELYICTAEPADRAAAIATTLIPVHALTGGDYAKADAGGGGRQITVAAQNGHTANADGNATHVVICSGAALIYVTTCTSQAITNGNTVNVPAWVITIGDPT